MNEKDKKILKEIWGKYTFEDILNFGLENNFIDSSGIIHASDIYKDPNKEYDDEEIKEIISSRGLRDIIGIIQDEYSLEDIIDELPTSDILDYISADDRLESLRDTWELEQYEEEIKEETYRDYVDTWAEEYSCTRKEIMEEILPKSSDDWREFLCDHFFNCSYYDNETFNKEYNKLKEDIDKSNYAQLCN